DYESLISQVQQQAADDDLLRQLHSSAESKFKETKDFIFLAESILKCFSDIPWTRQVYAKAEQATDANANASELATSIARKLDDRKWVVRVRSM
ncbi:hypothetical protein ACFL9U_08660, partial [Thermodesulfobacteriota bacterium]